MVLVEMITKHYQIFDERVPIELTFYDNGDGCNVVARFLNLSVSTKTGDNMDEDIISVFENMISFNMKQNNINNLQEYLNFERNPNKLCFKVSDEYGECPVCLENEQQVFPFSCKHTVCSGCSSKIDKCPLCRNAISCHESSIVLVNPSSNK